MDILTISRLSTQHLTLPAIPLGYVLTVTAKDGSQGSITFSVGIQNDGTVNGYSITSISETPGLGMKAQEEPFYSQFEGKNVDLYGCEVDTVCGQ